MRIMPDCDVDGKAEPGNQLTHLKESSACSKYEKYHQCCYKLLNQLYQRYYINLKIEFLLKEPEHYCC